MIRGAECNQVAKRLVPAVLNHYGAITRAALKRYLPITEPRRYLYDLVRDYPARGGRMMRPSLCIAAARMYGGEIEDAVRTAASIELLHNALLIHDDIEDGSEERRGRATLHVLYGVPLALNAGDALSLMALRPLLENRQRLGERLALRIIEETERTARELAEGQALELGWRRFNTTELDSSNYFEMVLKKTCWLATIHPLRVGALIGSGDKIEPERFIHFGFFLGAAFQIQDDLMNLLPDERYGKERNGDLWEGKRSLMVIHAFGECSPDEKQRLAAVLAKTRQQRTLKDVNWMQQLIARYGSIEYAREIANGLAGAAQHEFSILAADVPPSDDRRFLEQMTRWVVERN